MSFAKQMLVAELGQSAWANQCLLDGCTALTADDLGRDFRISHNSILATLCHISHGEIVWLDCLCTTADKGTWRLPIGAAPKRSLDELRRKWPEIWDAYDCWLEEQSQTSLRADLNLQLPGALEARLPGWRILRHVLHHSTLHRGQIVGMMRMLGHQPPPNSPMDYYLAGEGARSA
ncbi:MAG: DinB family protein [Candidatus Sulfotelmatobacter sp.]